MEANRLKEVLEIIKKFFVETEKTGGICDAISFYYIENYITLNETYYIKNYLRHNKPTPNNDYKEFTQNQYWQETYHGYWWKNVILLESRQLRIDYLTKLIANIK